MQKSIYTQNRLKEPPVIVYTINNPNIKEEDVAITLKNLRLHFPENLKPIYLKFNSTDSIDEFLVDWKTDNIFGGSCFFCNLQVDQAGLIFNEMNSIDKKYSITIMYNGSDHYSLPHLTHVLNLAIQTGCDVDVQATAFMQDTSTTSLSALLFLRIGPYMYTFGIAFLISLFCQVLVVEKEKKLKDLLLISGVSIPTYWFSRLLSDSLLYFIIASFQIIIGGVVVGSTPFTKNSLLAILILYFLYGVLLMATGYLVSFLFKTGEDAAKWCSSFVALSVSMLFLIVSLLFKSNIPHSVQYVLSLIPTYSLYYGIFTIFGKILKMEGLTLLGLAVLNDDLITVKSLFTLQGYGKHMMTLFGIIALEAILFIAILLGIEFYLIWKKRPKNQKLNLEDEEEEDDDVIQERERVYGGVDDLLQIIGLSKRFSKKGDFAIRNLTLGIPSGECFALLGPNGAGKTTIINVISRIIPANSGKCLINNYNIFTSPTKAFENLGICPQENRLWDELTGREHIRIFSMMRGIFDKNYTIQMINKFDLLNDSNKCTKDYSGGNKRKLQVALAFIGEPKVVLLDEPTAGMDPSVRRSLWNRILNLQSERAIVLTTHSMEEADALCSRIGIMVNGKLKCIGSSQHLKNKFGGGYRLSLTANESSMKRIDDWLKKECPKAKLINRISRTMHYEIPQEGTSLANMFKLVEDNRENLGITDYSISQTTLEQVFLNFAKLQI